MTFEQTKEVGAEVMLEKLRDELKDKTYRLGPVDGVSTSPSSTVANGRSGSRTCGIAWRRRR